MAKMEQLYNQNDLSCTGSILIFKKLQHTISFKRQFYKPTLFSFAIPQVTCFSPITQYEKVA